MNFQHIHLKQKLKSKIRLLWMVTLISDTSFRTTSWYWNILLHICNKSYELVNPSLSSFIPTAWRVLRIMRTDRLDKAKSNIEGKKPSNFRSSELYPLLPTQLTSGDHQLCPNTENVNLNPVFTVFQQERHVSRFAKFSRSLQKSLPVTWQV